MIFAYRGQRFGGRSAVIGLIVCSLAIVGLVGSAQANDLDNQGYDADRPAIVPPGAVPRSDQGMETQAVDIVEPPFDSDGQAERGPQVYTPTGPLPELGPGPADRPDSPGIYVALQMVIDSLEASGDPVGIVQPSEDYKSIVVPLVGLSPLERFWVWWRLQTEVNELGEGFWVVITEAKVTRGELEALNAEVKAAMASMDVGDWGVGILASDGVVNVLVNESTSMSVGELTSQLTQQIESSSFYRSLTADVGARASSPALVLGDLVRVEPASFDDLKADVAEGYRGPTDQRTVKPLFASKWISFPTGKGYNYGCTAGFMMRRGNGDVRGTSAAHCTAALGVVGDDVYAWDYAVIGTTVANIGISPTSADVVAFTAHNVPWPLVTPHADGRAYLVKAEVIQGAVGFQFCTGGWSLWYNEGVEYSCGRLDLVDMDLNMDGTEHLNLDCIRDDGYTGQSGGAVWFFASEESGGGVWAAGHVAGGLTRGIWGVRGTFTCHHVMADIRAATGYDLLMWPNQR